EKITAAAQVEPLVRCRVEGLEPLERRLGLDDEFVVERLDRISILVVLDEFPAEAVEVFAAADVLGRRPGGREMLGPDGIPEAVQSIRSRNRLSEPLLQETVEIGLRLGELGTPSVD